MPSKHWMRRVPPILLALASACLLTACSAYKPSASAPILLPDISTQIKRCSAPVVLPNRALTQAEVEQLWARDRVALINCGLSLDAVLDFYERLAAELKGASR